MPVRQEGHYAMVWCWWFVPFPCLCDQPSNFNPFNPHVVLLLKLFWFFQVCCYLEREYLGGNGRDEKESYPWQPSYCLTLLGNLLGLGFCSWSRIKLCPSFFSLISKNISWKALIFALFKKWLCKAIALAKVRSAQNLNRREEGNWLIGPRISLQPHLCYGHLKAKACTSCWFLLDPRPVNCFNLWLISISQIFSCFWSIQVQLLSFMVQGRGE